MVCSGVRTRAGTRSCAHDEDGPRYGVGLPRGRGIGTSSVGMSRRTSPRPTSRRRAIFLRDGGGWVSGAAFRNKPFAVVSKAIGLFFVLTQKASAASNVHRSDGEGQGRELLATHRRDGTDAVPDGILTNGVRGTDQRAAVAKVIRLMVRASPEHTASVRRVWTRRRCRERESRSSAVESFFLGVSSGEGFELLDVHFAVVL